MANNRFYISDHVKVEEQGDGVSLVSCRLPSHLVADIIEVLDLLLHISRWMHTRTRAAESSYLAKRFKKLQHFNKYGVLS
ncbi:hypothetical protein FDZ73_06370 [bacterium]|nr:MAG: hypothetical protein FDZ73_06370 [bacterium]